MSTGLFLLFPGQNKYNSNKQRFFYFYAKRRDYQKSDTQDQLALLYIHGNRTAGAEIALQQLAA